METKTPQDVKWGSFSDRNRMTLTVEQRGQGKQRYLFWRSASKIVEPWPSVRPKKRASLYSSQLLPREKHAFPKVCKHKGKPLTNSSLYICIYTNIYIYIKIYIYIYGTPPRKPCFREFEPCFFHCFMPFSPYVYMPACIVYMHM